MTDGQHPCLTRFKTHKSAGILIEKGFVPLPLWVQANRCSCSLSLCSPYGTAAHPAPLHRPSPGPPLGRLLLSSQWTGNRMTTVGHLWAQQPKQPKACCTGRKGNKLSPSLLLRATVSWLMPSQIWNYPSWMQPWIFHWRGVIWGYC